MDGSSIGQINSPSKKINSFSTDIDRVIREFTLSVHQKEPQSGDQICTQHLSNPRPVKLSTWYEESIFLISIQSVK